MEQPLTAKALAHLPPYLPLQTFFLEQYYSQPFNQKGNSSSKNSNNTNGGNPMFSLAQSNQSQSHHQSHHTPNSSLLTQGFSLIGQNSSSSGLQQQQSSQYSFQNTHHHLHSQSHSQVSSQQLQQQLPNLQLQQQHSQSSQHTQHQMLMMEMLSTSDGSEEGGQANALQMAHCQQLNQMKKMEQKYKTELCKNWVSKGICQYGQKCRFAHGKEELIERLAMNKNYKTKLCTAFHKERVCQYAARCHFKHDERLHSEIRSQYIYQKYICSLDDSSIASFQFGQISKRLPIFKKLSGLELTEEDMQINALEQSDLTDIYSQSTSTLSQMMIMMLNNENPNQLQQQPANNSPFYLMNCPSSESTSTQNSMNNYNNVSGQNNLHSNFFIPSTNNLFNKNNYISVKQCSQDKDLSMISNSNTAETSESISIFSLTEKFNSIPSAEKLEKLASTSQFA